MLTFGPKSNISIHKSDLRKKIKIRLGSLSEREIARKSLFIEKRLFRLEVVKASAKVGIYASFQKEVLTRKIIEVLVLRGIEVFIPVISDRNLEFKKISSLSDLVVGRFGILEPSSGCKPIISNDIECLILPCVAIDKNGNRLGRGKGYYDRFLAKNSGIVTVCLGFNMQVIPELKVNESDQKVDFIITETKTIRVENEQSEN